MYCFFLKILLCHLKKFLCSVVDIFLISLVIYKSFQNETLPIFQNSVQFISISFSNSFLLSSFMFFWFFFSWNPLKYVCCLFSHIWLFVAPWTVACQAPLSTGFSRKEYWSRLPCPPPGDLPHSGTEPASLCLLHWQAGSLPLAPAVKPPLTIWWCFTPVLWITYNFIFIFYFFIFFSWLLGKSLKLIFQLTHLFFVQIHPTCFLIVYFNFPAE